MEDLQGTRVGGYVIERKLGEGGMGSVWFARNPINHKRVAVKVIRGDLLGNEQLTERFKREAIAASEVKHPNIVEVYDVAQLPDGRYYIVMEFLDGGDLDTFLRSFGKLGAEDTLRIVGPIASALEAMHEAGIVHRDLKPSNVILVDGENRLVKVVDFGLAKVVAGATERSFVPPRLTHAGLVAGTSGYMSPEQASAFAQADGRADVYSLGMIAIRCVAGRLPFVRDTPEDNLFAILERSRENPGEVRTLLEAEAAHLQPGWFDALVRSVAYRPEDRYQNARDLPLELANVTDDGERALRSVAPRFWQCAPPSAATIKNPRGQVPTESIKRPPPALPLLAPPDAPTTLRGAAGAVTPAPSPTPFSQSRLVLLAAGVAGLAVVVVALVIYSTDGNEPRPAASAPAIVDARMSAPASAAPSLEQLRVTTDPPGARVSVDGTSYGPAPALVTAPAGTTVHLRAELDGYNAVEQIVTVQAGTSEVKLALAVITQVPVPIPVDAGSTPTPKRTRDNRDSHNGRALPSLPHEHQEPPATGSGTGSGSGSNFTFDPNRPLGPR